MSIDLELRSPHYITKKELEEIIFPLGWTTDKRYSSYIWYQTSNFESTRGAWLDLRYVENAQYRKTKTIITSSTNAGRSYEDLEAQNNVLKVLKGHFGGYIYNTQDGTRNYIFNDIPKLLPLEKAIGFVYITFSHNIIRASIIVEEVDERIIKSDDLYIASLDKSLLRNNTVIPFLVTSLETLLKYTFIKYIENDDDAIEQIYKKNDRIHYSKLKGLLTGETSMAEIEAKEFNFQNLSSAHEGYKKYIGIDLFSILNKDIEYEGVSLTFRVVLSEIIEMRHEFIHEGVVNTKLGSKKMKKYIYFMKEFGSKFIEEFNYKKNLRLDLEELL
ncbi:hypothetical protein QUF95_21045 [Paenibacillus silvae]|uniref:hypothetical protein n=1 Tax=Paenibacillus silvae TaxID=1325358 RepID=UPI0025A02AED|nr:hypothetical protein [Paenibacillus silvae]MDM5279895.1 hypothetical protein [Paenibacillus silvae]